MKTDICVIGGGAGGLAAALSSNDDGVSVLLVEREGHLGGILNQCIHNGFGLEVFKEELTGPEYAERFIKEFEAKKIPHLLNTTVIDIRKTKDFLIDVSNEANGLFTIEAKAVILATGCYERTRGGISIPGDRPRGVMPAGSAQRYLNIDGHLVGKNIFILGSGDIGLIMARRMTLEGAHVHGVAEIMPYSNGLTRNIVQCLHDFDIPLYLSHTVTDIKGKDILESVTIQEVDSEFHPIGGTEKTFEVDALLLSVGLLPDVHMFESIPFEKSQETKSAVVNQFCETSIEGLFVCGNALHVHDLVDWVTKESQKAGHFAKKFVKNPVRGKSNLKPVETGGFVRVVVPQKIDFGQMENPFELSFRVSKKMEEGILRIEQNGKTVREKRYKHLAPAEMESIRIDPSFLSGDHPIRLIVEEVVK